MTGTGVLGSLTIFAGFWLSNLDHNYLWLASFGFVVNWFGDSLDGTVARYRKIQKPKYGFFIDHTVDALSTVLIFIGLGVSPYMRFEIASLALIGYLLMSILVYIRTCVNGEFKISYAKMGPTEMRAIAILANTLVYATGNPKIPLVFTKLTVYDLIGSVIAVLLIIVFVISTLRQANELSQYDQNRDELFIGKKEEIRYDNQ